MLFIRYLQHHRKKQAVKFGIVYYNNSPFIYKTRTRTIRYKPQPSL